jgi:hypothetical protein
MVLAFGVTTTTGRLVLFLHVLAAIALLGPTFVFPFLPGAVPPPYPMPVLRVMRLIEDMVLVFLFVQLATGVWLIWLGDWNDDFSAAKWLQVSIGLFIVAAGLGTGFQRPRLKRVLQLSERGDDAGAMKVPRADDGEDRRADPRVARCGDHLPHGLQAMAGLTHGT